MHMPGAQNVPMPSLNLANSGFSTIQAYGLPYDIILAADPDSRGQALLHKIGLCQTVVPSIHELLAYIRSPLQLSVTGYMVCSANWPYSS